MDVRQEQGLADAVGWRREVLYRPAERPGFVAWTTAFDYGDGSIGLCFKETLRQPNPDYTEGRLEFAESVASVYSYSTVTWGNPNQRSYRVYMRSVDGGQTFAETGRAPENIGCYCNIGFPNGRILGFHVPNVNEAGDSWAHRLEVRESTDGGTTWAVRHRLLEGNAIYLWRVRQLPGGMIVVMASLYGTAWGPGHARATRNTMLPDETYLDKVQAFFLASTDGGETFTGPHYILPGTGAHEYDVVETEDGALLFIAGDVQATPVARQRVRYEAGRFLNEPVRPIKRGAPVDAKDSQSGFVPETIVRLADGLLVGARRNKPYACSADEGENWYEIDGLPPSLYQPFMLRLPDGRVANFGHHGGDVSFGQADMYIGMDCFGVDSRVPRSSRLSLARCLAPDGSHYANCFRARLTSGGAPVAGKAIVFAFTPYWNRAEPVETLLPEHAPYALTAVTDAEGYAEAGVDAYDRAGDIHFAYSVHAAFTPADGDALAPCESPTIATTALRPYRRNAHPYEAYFAEGTLYLSPALLRDFPDAPDRLAPCVGNPEGLLPEGLLPAALLERLQKSHVLTARGGTLYWKPSVHAPCPLAAVSPMAEGDWYV